MSDKHTPGPREHSQELTKLLDTIGRRNRIWPDRNCKHCGNAFRPSDGASKYCSRPCAWANNGGKNKKETHWWKNASGYIEGRIWVSETRNIRVKQHRYVVELAIGRKLLPHESVHHINGVKDDNRLENLEVMSHGEHTREHSQSRIYNRGYKLSLTPEQRKARSDRAKKMNLGRIGRAAIKKARGAE